MTKCLRFVFAITVAITLHLTATSQSLSINTTGATADPSAILDVSSTVKGMLIPRMDKTQKNAIATPATGLLIYQTLPDSAGFHYYDGAQWVWLSGTSDSTAWKITGNSNITSSNFLGTLNDSALRFRIRNTQAGLLDSASGNTTYGYRSNAGFTTGKNNTFMGFRAGTLNDTTSYNTFIGYQAGERNRDSNNVAVGYRAGRYYSFNNQTATRMTSVGTEAGYGAFLNAKSTAIGYRALWSFQGGFIYGNGTGRNTAIGDSALAFAGYGFSNVGVGNEALSRVHDGYQNVAIGDSSMVGALSTINNVAIGFNTLTKQTGTGYNIAVGARALRNFSGGYPNTAIGYSSMDSTTTGFANTAVGSYSLTMNKTGINNVALGNAAMYQSTAGSNNTAVGNDAGRLIRNNDNTAIGGGALSKDSTGWGNTATGAYSATNVTSGIWNTANGYFALESDSTGSQNTAIGTSSFRSIRNASNNVGVGINTGYHVTSSNNTYLGSFAGEGAAGFSTGESNTGVGYFALSDIRSGTENVAVGRSALLMDTSGTANVAVGRSALRANLASHYNTAIGHEALLLHKRAGSTYNTAVGAAALEQDSSGFQNTGLGVSTFRNNKTGFYNTGVGINAGYYQKESYNTFIGGYSGMGERTSPAYVAADTGSYNTGLGFFSLYEIANGENNVAVGYSAMRNDSSGNLNTAVGNGALFSNTGSHTNNAFGWNALYSYDGTGNGFNSAFGDLAAENLQTGLSNVAIGSWAMRSHISGSSNTIVGNSAMGITGTSGSSNTAVGSNALLVTNADGNTAVGRNAGNTNTTGTNNTLIGFDADVTATGLTNATAIGYNATVSQSNSLVLGQASTNVGINTTAPGARLHIRRNGASGGTFIGNPSLIIEDNAQSYVQLSNPTATENGILSGNAVSTIRSGIVFGADSTVFLRSGGNNTRILIDNNGYVGIGTTPVYPLTQLHLYEPLATNVNLRVASFSTSYEPGIELIKTGPGTDWKMRAGAASGTLIFARSSDDFVTPIDEYEMSSTSLRPFTDGTNSLGLVGNRWTTVYATVGAINTSDARDKENIADLNYGLSEIMKLRPVSFNWKENPQWGKKIGFIAQEVQPILGEVVQVGDLKTKTPQKDDNGKALNANSDKLGIYYSDIIPVTVKAIQEQQQTIQTQQKQIEDLKKKNEQLEKDMQAIKTKLGINN